MEALFNRYRNLTVLLAVLIAQLLLLAYQVRTNQEVRLIRVWAVGGIMPLARLVEGIRANTTGFLREYLLLLDTREENIRLREAIGKLKMENQFLRTELSTAERARALASFQERSPSRTVAARIIGAGTGANSKVVYIDVGSRAGVSKGMAVVTPDGIVGKVIAAYPAASQVMLITDPSFAAGVVSQKGRVHGTLKGQGHSVCLVDHVQSEEKVAVGEWFYTTGDDRVFPKGLPAGQVRIVRPGKIFQEIYLTPSGLQHGIEEVLVVLEGVHQLIPDPSDARQDFHLLPAPPEPCPAPEDADAKLGALSTDADQILDRYRRIGEAQGHVYGEATGGGRAPNFNIRPAPVRPPERSAAPGAARSPEPAPPGPR